MIWLVGALIIALLVLRAIPSGPACPECESHYTEHFKLNAIRLATGKKVCIEIKYCYRCNHKWDILEDGLPAKPKEEQDELVQESSPQEENAGSSSSRQDSARDL